MIIFLGESASGKTTVAAKFIEKHPDYHPLITYTTRPKRDGEENDVDYHFVSDERYDKLNNEGKFIDTAEYNGWKYGLSKEDCDDEKAVLIATPSILRNTKMRNIDYKSIYLKVDRRSRLVVSLWRGDGSDRDVDESCRRSISDCGMFDGVENEVDYVIDNDNFNMDIDEVVKKVETFVFGEQNE